MQERVPNRQLADLMREAKVGNKGLAGRMRELSRQDGGPAIKPTHTNVDKWLSGETQRPRERACHVLAKVLAERTGRPITTADLGYGPDVPAEPKGTLRYPDSVTESVSSLGDLTEHDLRPTPQTDRLIVMPEVWSEVVTRWMFDNAEAAQPVESRPITESDVAAVRDATAMFSGFDYRYGGGRGKPLVAQFLECEVQPLLRYASPSSTLGRKYFREVAALARLAGWTAYDVGQHYLAQGYLLQAFSFAKAADDRPLCGRIMAGMSHQANFLGHYDKAVHLARAASQGAAGRATPTTMALFRAMEARALASKGVEGEVTAALSAAEEWLGKSIPEEDPSWIKYFDAAELHAEFAHCFRDLNKSELATQHAAKSIEVSESIYVRSLSFCRTVLAESYVQSNELERAVEVAKGVINTAANLKSYRVRSYIRDFSKRLNSSADGHVVADFNDHVTANLPEMSI